MRTASALPRIASGAPRWTSTWLQTIAAPLPIVATAARTAASTIVGEAAASPNPAAISASAPGYTRRMPKAPSAEAAKKLPITSPTPVALTRKPSPTLPASRSCLAKITSATLMHAVATAAVLQTTSTVTRWRELTTRSSPSRNSLQWPLVSGASERSALPAIRATRTAESRKVAAFVQYARSTPSEARSRPAMAGPIVHATFSTVVSSDVACSRSSSETRFGSPAHTAGRKNPWRCR